ncbi:MAG: hypothetical protein ACK55Z_24495, partial [bacterium]
VNTLGISLNKNLIFQYLGGPGSVYGVGTTTIKRVVDTTKLKSRNAMIYQELKEQTINANRVFDKETRTTKVTTNIQDFRNTTQGDGWTGSPLQTDKRFYVSAGSYKDKMNLL